MIAFMLSSLVGTHMGINLPDSCTECPSYGEIAWLYPDNTNQQISGKVVDGERENGKNPNHYKWYLYQSEDKHYWWIDPPADTMFRVKMITIQPLEIWKSEASHKMMSNDTRVTWEHTRWVDSKCRNAVIDVDTWFATLGDTINYMKNDCDPKYTNIKTNMTIWYNYTAPIQKDIHKEYMHQKWLLEAQESCLDKC